ncbi:MAG: LysE family transporter [Peptostreptococcaceae bacterium]|nr:LysE family transporter [Peptostreptococcaceae bacterium]
MFQTGAFLSYVIVVSFTPGPNNILSMVNASRDGFKKTFGFLTGVFSGFLTLLLLSSYFNLILFNLMPKIKIFMSIVGAAYMTYLAIKIMKSKPKTDGDNPNSNKTKRKVNSFTTGLAMQFVNPKGVLYCITVVANFIIPYYKSSISLLLFSLFLALVGFSSVCCWALFGSLFNRFIVKHQKPFNIAMGLLLFYSAYSISGIAHLF